MGCFGVTTLNPGDKQAQIIGSTLDIKNPSQ